MYPYKEKKVRIKNVKFLYYNSFFFFIYLN